jgi:hypothetical protein
MSEATDSPNRITVEESALSLLAMTGKCHVGGRKLISVRVLKS